MAFIAIKLIREINILLSFLSFIKKVNFSYSQKKRLIYTLESIVSENDQESIVSENGQESIVSENQAAIMARRLLVCFLHVRGEKNTYLNKFSEVIIINLFSQTF